MASNLQPVLIQVCEAIERTFRCSFCKRRELINVNIFKNKNEVPDSIACQNSHKRLYGSNSELQSANLSAWFSLSSEIVRKKSKLLSLLR